MTEGRPRIGIVAPGSRIEPVAAEKVKDVARALYGEKVPEIFFHPQCFLSDGHFAGDDGVRRQALVEVANDTTFDAVWFAKGGYGSCRLLDGLSAELSSAARKKTYLGYSDAGSILAALYGQGLTGLAHGPMPADINRDGGRKAVERALRYLVDRDATSLEGSLSPQESTVAFNITILSQLLGTPFQPDLAGHVLMLEEVSEYMYRIDRALFHITSNPEIRRVAGIRLGRCSDVPANDPDFVRTEEQVVQHWCASSGIAYLGRADIGHDIENKVVPFGPFEAV